MDNTTKFHQILGKVTQHLGVRGFHYNGYDRQGSGSNHSFKKGSHEITLHHDGKDSVSWTSSNYGHGGHKNGAGHIDSFKPEHIKEEVLNEDFRTAARLGIGDRQKHELKKGADLDYYHPKTGDKHYGKVNSLGTHHYTVKDHKTKKVHRFYYWNETLYKNRAKGVGIKEESMSTLKIIKEAVLNEISKKTLGSYVNKATDDVSYHSFNAGGLHTSKSKTEKDEALNSDKKAWKRLKGIKKAVGELSK